MPMLVLCGGVWGFELKEWQVCLQRQALVLSTDRDAGDCSFNDNYWS
ncbi:hypothetical protein IAE50_19955 [Kosakonia sp. S42]|nr:hypothetical protein [Kosakonia sp. S42]